jgi:hypothetical protein
MSLVIATINAKGATFEILKDGQADAYYMMQITPFLKERLLSDNPGNIVANTCPARRTTQPLPDHGRWMWVDEKGEPVFIDQSDRIRGHNITVGGTGTGKSVDQLKDDKRAVEDGKKAIHMLPKADKKSNAIRLCQHLHGKHLVFSPEDCPNIFMPYFSKSMDRSYSAYQTAFNKFSMRSAEEVGLLIGPSFTKPQKNWAYNSVIKACYEKDMITEDGRVRKDRIKDFEDGAAWPDFLDIKAVWRKWLSPKIPDPNNPGKQITNPEYIKEVSTRQVIQALESNTSYITPYGPYRGLISKKPMVFDESYTLVDISGLLDDPNIQNALIYHCLGAIQSELELVPDDSEQPEVFITIDEGATLMEMAKMRQSFKKMFRELRSFGGRLSMNLTDLATTPRPMINLLKQNVDYILLACNASSYNIRPLVKEFALTANDIRHLRKKGQGNFLLLYGDVHLPVFSALTLDDEEAILNRKQGIFNGGKQATDPNYLIEPLVDPRVEWVWKKYGLFCKDWLIGAKKTYLPAVRDYHFEQFDHPFIGGKKTVYLRNNLEKPDGTVNLFSVPEHRKHEPHIENQTKGHYEFVYSLGGEISLMDADEVIGDDYGKKTRADLVVRKKQPDGNVISLAIEVEMDGSHTAEELEKKRDFLLDLKQDGKSVYDFVIFTCDHTYYDDFLRDVIGKEHSAPRGKQLKEKISKCLNGEIKPTVRVSKTRTKKQKTGNSPVSNVYPDEISAEVAPIETAL